MEADEFEVWLNDFSTAQRDSLRQLRNLINEHTSGLSESINEGKWLTGYIFYSSPSRMIYAIGPKGKNKITLHMMPFYGSTILQSRHTTALAPFLSGKSCIAFRDYSELPIANLVDIFKSGADLL